MSILELIKYIFLGIVQGLTEVLPISSSGHVAIFQQILSIDSDEGLLFLILVNFGSLISIFYYFRKMIYRLCADFILFIFKPTSRLKTREGFFYCLMVIIGIIPIGVVGLLFAGQINSFYQDHYLLIVGVGLLMTATFLFLAKEKAKNNGRQSMKFSDSIWIGIAQTAAILPGLSRSAVATTTGLFRKMSMETSLNFSFMLYIPISVGSFLQYVYLLLLNPNSDAVGLNPGNSYHWLYYAAALIASVFATYFALKLLFKLFRNGNLLPFSLYTFFVGMIVLIVGMTQ